MLSAMTAMRSGAEAQIELADAAIAMIVGCSNLANEAALATIGPAPDQIWYLGRWRPKAVILLFTA